MEVDAPKEIPECKHYWIFVSGEGRKRAWVSQECQLCHATKSYRAGNPPASLGKKGLPPVWRLLLEERSVVIPSVAPVREEAPIPAEVVEVEPEQSAADEVVATAPDAIEEVATEVEAPPEVGVIAGPEVQKCAHLWILKNIEGKPGWVRAKCDLCPAEKSYRVDFAQDIWGSSFSRQSSSAEVDEDELPLVEVETEEPEEEVDEIGEVVPDLAESDPIIPDAVSPEIRNRTNGSRAAQLYQDDVIATIIREEGARASKPLERKQSPPPVVLTQEMLEALLEEERRKL